MLVLYYIDQLLLLKNFVPAETGILRQNSENAITNFKILLIKRYKGLNFSSVYALKAF